MTEAPPGDVRNAVNQYWADALGAAPDVFHHPLVHVVVADIGGNDAMSLRIGRACVVAVGDVDEAQARRVVRGVTVDQAFTADLLRAVCGPDTRVDGPSVHAYADAATFAGVADPDARAVLPGDSELRALLEAGDVAEWAESGFPADLTAADPATDRFWLLREDDRVVAAGNLTEWRGRPADVGLLTAGGQRGRGLAQRLAGAMVSAALPEIGVARYRALATNTASLAVARRLGFRPYGANYRARRPSR